MPTENQKLEMGGNGKIWAVSGRGPHTTALNDTRLASNPGSAWHDKRVENACAKLAKS